MPGIDDSPPAGSKTMPAVTETTMLTLLMVATLDTFEQDPQELPDFRAPPGVQALLEE